MGEEDGPLGNSEGPSKGSAGGRAALEGLWPPPSRGWCCGAGDPGTTQVCRPLPRGGLAAVPVQVIGAAAPQRLVPPACPAASSGHCRQEASNLGEHRTAGVDAVLSPSHRRFCRLLQPTWPLILPFLPVETPHALMQNVPPKAFSFPYFEGSFQPFLRSSYFPGNWMEVSPPPTLLLSPRTPPPPPPPCRA